QRIEQGCAHGGGNSGSYELPIPMQRSAPLAGTPSKVRIVKTLVGLSAQQREQRLPLQPRQPTERQHQRLFFVGEIAAQRALDGGEHRWFKRVFRRLIR